MKTTFKLLASIFFLSLTLLACEKENEEGELSLEFKTGTTYTSVDTSVADGTAILIGLEGETSKPKDPLIRFNISESIQNGTPQTVYQEDISTTYYTYDYAFVFNDSNVGQVHTYTFTITNKDGFIKQKTLNITVE